MDSDHFIIGSCLAFSQLFLIFAYRLADPARLGPYIYITIFFTAILNWLIWKQVPTLIIAMGILLMVFGGVVVVYEKKRIKNV